MEWLTFANIATTLIVAFTGLTGYATWRTHRDRLSQRIPTVFVRCDEHDNGCTINVTLRNRANHPMRVRSIHVENSRQIALVEFRSGMSSSTWSQVHGKGSASSQFDIDMTLTSSGKDGDTGSRKYILTARNPPAYIKLLVNYDPADGSQGEKVIKRMYKFSEAERAAISEFKASEA